METMFTIDTDAAVSRFMDLATIPGKSGEEKAVMTRLIEILSAAGVPEHCFAFDDAHTRTPGGGQIGNLIVRVPGTIAGPTTVLSAHTDTVPVCIGARPVQDGDVIRNQLGEDGRSATGLGADDRAGCAAMVTAAMELLRSNQPYAPFTLLFCIQEEIGLYGARYLNRETLGLVDRAFNFDGGSVEKLVCGAIGGERATITVHGIAAHAGVAPQMGVSAIVIASLAIASLHQNGWLGLVNKPGLFAEPQSCSGTANVGIFNGGDATNVITPLVKMRAEARSHNPAMRARIIQEIQAAFEQAAASVTNDSGVSGCVEFKSTIEYEAFALPDDDASVIAGEAAVRAVIGDSGRTTYREISNGGLDANWLYRHGIGAVTLGCGQQNIHTVDETLSIPAYLDACRIALHLIGNPPVVPS